MSLVTLCLFLILITWIMFLSFYGFYLHIVLYSISSGWKKDTFKSALVALLLRNSTNFMKVNNLVLMFTLVRMEVPKRSPLPVFPVTSPNVCSSLQNFLNFSFNIFSTLVWNFKFIRSASPKLLNLNRVHPSKKAVFLVKSL